MTANPNRFAHVVASLASIVAVLFSTPAIYSQATWARLVGSVTDPSGAFVPGADVTATNTATNIQYKALTNERGDYLIDKLPPGTYDVTTELSGFKKQGFLAVRLQTEQVGRVDFVLSTGEIAEKVEVIGVQPIINTERTEIGSVVEQHKIRELPLKGRDITKLAFLTTGGTQEGQEVSSLQYYYGGGTPNFNGLYSHSNQITLDGSNNLGYINSRMTVSPTPETVQEFKVVTSNYSAEYGKVGGAVISIVSKSGTNAFHGDAWYYFRNESLDANSFFNNRTTRGKLPVDYQIFGGDFGGPIFKNKTFFYGSYEHFIDDFAVTGFATVPSLKRRSGDFSEADGPFAQTQLYDPFNVVDGSRVPFQGNVIPASRINPTTAKLMQQLPIPEPNVAGAKVNNYSYPNTRTSRINKWSTRVDHHFEGGDTLFGRFNWQNTPIQRHTGVIGAPGMLAGIYEQIEEPSGGYNIAGGWVKPIGAEVVSELNVASWRSRWLISRSIDGQNWGEMLGFDNVTPGKYPITNPDGTRGPGGMPRVSPAGYISWGPGAVESPLGDWGIEAKYSLTWRKGNHYLKFGIGHTRNFNVNYTYVPQAVGSSDYDGYLTGQVTRNAAGQISGATLGDPFADFLLGTPSNASVNLLGGNYSGSESAFDQSHYSAFVQDEWKTGRNVTLSMGLRWEQARPPFYKGDHTGTYKQDYYYCAFDLSAGRWNPAQLFPEGFDIQQWAGGDLSTTSVPYRNLDRRGCYEPRYSYFTPRLGLAWKMFGTNRTVLRVGAGSSVDTEFGVLRTNTLAANIGTVVGVQTRGAAPAMTFGKYNDLPSLASTAEYTSGYYYNNNWQEGRVYSYNMNIQHELFRGTMVEVGYVGNQGRHLRHMEIFNMAMPAGYDKVVLQNGEPLPISSAPVTLPGKNVVFSGQKARRPYPQLVPNFRVADDGSMRYDSLQSRVERRFASGWALSAGYTWAKAMGLNYDGAWQTPLVGVRMYEKNLVKAPMQSDRTHTAYSSFVWDMPFFRNGGWFTRTVLGGWEVANILTLTSGQPFSVNVGVDVLDLGTRGNQHPDRLKDGALPKDERTVDRFFDTSAFGCSAPGCPVVLQTTSFFGAGNSAPRPLRGAAVPLVDLSLHKQFFVTERQKFDFHVDMFNAFNHPIFNNPNGNVATANGGRVTSTASPRQIMFGFRYSF